uniref:Uncharacterized protein n=1 Tax=Arundo donax TaxID=35708 RepID=A0A0A9GVS4_ARUDO
MHGAYEVIYNGETLTYYDFWWMPISMRAM